MNENKSTQNEANNNRKKSTQHHPQNPRFSKMLDSKAALSKRGLVVIQSSGIRISMKNQLLTNPVRHCCTLSFFL